jgi:hypothetical protein
LKTEKQVLQSDIDSLNVSADQFAEKAESSYAISYIVKYGLVRKAAKEKMSSVSDLQQ